MNMKPMINAPFYGAVVAADARRVEFNHQNEVLVQNECDVSFVFIGDSITHFWELNAYFNEPNQRIVNRGISGDATHYVLKRFEADVIQLKPQYCVLGIGINDICALTCNRFSDLRATPLDEIIETAFDNITSAAALCQEANVKLIITSLLPNNMYWLEDASERSDYPVQLNARLKAFCLEHNHIYVDYHTAFLHAAADAKLDDFLTDGLHPNVFGYNIMAKTLKDTLRTYGISI